MEQNQDSDYRSPHKNLATQEKSRIFTMLVKVKAGKE
jgi:hypothetical protein